MFPNLMTPPAPFPEITAGKWMIEFRFSGVNQA
jgi:hypothetical protein